MKKIFNSILTLCLFLGSFSLSAQTYDIVWTDLVGVVASGSSVTKNSGTSAWDAGAASVNLLPSGTDGWVQMTATQTNTHRMLGLSSTNTNANFNTINFAIHLRPDGNVRVYENGENRGTLSTYVSGNDFRVEREGTSILYKKNGSTFYTSTLTSSSALIADCSIHSDGGTVANAVASFNSGGGGGPTCSDGIQNGDETGVDCGGSCPPCAPTCSDGIQNGDETGVDCGGSSCPPCSGGGGGGFFVNDDGASDTDIRYSDGKVVIGDDAITKPGDYRLYVGGGVLTEKVKVAIESTGDWADYVFEKDHNLIPLSEVEKSIQKNKHLPNVPSAKEMVKNGLNVAEMDATLLRQIEELWLHTIQLKKENEALRKRLEALENKK